MANSHVGRQFIWDTVSGAVSPYTWTKVKRITVYTPTGSAGGDTTVKQNGQNVVNIGALPSETTHYEYDNGYNMKDLTMTAVGTGTVVTVEYM